MEARRKTIAPEPLEGEFGAEYLAWEVWDKPNYQRGPLWYAAMVLIGMLLLLYAVFSANFLFALIILMFGLILYLTTKTPPARIRAAITDDGILLGRMLYPYRDIGSFWMVYDPPAVKSLYLDFRNALQSQVVIDLEDSNPNMVRERLARFVREDVNRVDEPLSDMVGRFLKI
jgi:hypothetical protein